MSASSARSGSIARKVATTSVALMALSLALIVGGLSLMAGEQTRQRNLQWAEDRAQAVADTVDAFDLTSRQQVERLFSNFKTYFPEGLRRSDDGKALVHGAQSLEGHFVEVDRFAQATGGVATVFVREGEDFRRIATSLKKENGERAVGTKLDRKHPAYPIMLQGGVYSGRAVLFGTPYMTHYETVKDASGQVVGILFIGLDITSFEKSVATLVNDTRFHESGGLWLVDPKGSLADAVFVVHPTAQGKKVLETLPGAEAALKALADGAGQLRGAAGLVNGDDKRWAVIARTKGSKLWVVGQLSERESMATFWRTIYTLWGVLVVAVAVLGTALVMLMKRWIAQPLAGLREAVGAVAEGDLTRAFHSDQRDDIGELVRSVEAMRQRLASSLGSVRVSAEGISTASAEIASGNQDLSVRTEQTASNLEKTASAMEQLSGTVRQTADSARTANQLAASAAEAAQRGGNVVSQVVANMEDINTSSRKIADIIGTIDGIAFQTNILALNAAVEAARAGEQGRGFAVVASEVRSLAQRSATAAREIKTLIGASVEKVESGSRLVQDAGSSMTEIVTSVQRVTDIIGEITHAAAEQSQGIASVSQSVTQLDQMTQQNAALVEESAAAAASLREQAQQLAEAVGMFRVNHDAVALQPTGWSGRAPSAPPTLREEVAVGALPGVDRPRLT